MSSITLSRLSRRSMIMGGYSCSFAHMVCARASG
jgi:hypothetical protein